MKRTLLIKYLVFGICPREFNSGNKQNISFKFDVLTAPGILSIRSPIKASMSTNCDGCKPPNLSWKSSRPKDTILQKEDVHESFCKES